MSEEEVRRRLWLEADELGAWQRPHGVHERWADLGAGLLLTLAQQAGYAFDSFSLKAFHSWAQFRIAVRGYDLLCMNLRSWRFPWATRAAEIFKSVNPHGQVWVGGMHCTAQPQAVAAVAEFDRIVAGHGEETLLALLGGTAFAERVLHGSAGLYADPDRLPFIDRELWPRHAGPWPLEGPPHWAPGPTATMLTSRSCPFACTFCSPERRHFGATRRRSVDSVLAELQMIDRRWGPLGSVVFHDSLFFQHPRWLEEFIRRYPPGGGWPFWAAARPDMLVALPELAEELLVETPWRAVSVGFESGSQRGLALLGKGYGPEVNRAAIALLNRVSERIEANGGIPPRILVNIVLAWPGETHEEARATVAMARGVRNGEPGYAYYSPYPGTPLGDRLIAEGQALDEAADFASHRPKVQGVDYGWYDALLAELR